MKNEFRVKYVSKETIEPAFGYAKGNQAIVREDLKPGVKKFVTNHELYHLRDEFRWGGWIGKEIRANVSVGLKDPVGLLETFFASMTIERIKFYVVRFRLHR